MGPAGPWGQQVHANSICNTYCDDSCAGSFTDTLPKQAEALDGVGVLTLHGVKPNIADTASTHGPQAPVHSSPVSSDLPCNVPRGCVTAVSSTTASTTAANVSCCSGRGGTTRIVASASPHVLNQAAVPLQRTRQECADFSATVADNAASQVMKLVFVH